MFSHGKTQLTSCQSVNTGIDCATSRNDVEWLEPDIIDAEVSRLVNGAISFKNPPRWRSSMSSGYSSHSPPLSAGTYSTCCAPVLPSSVTGTITDVGLAVIHEADIPRPIWPSKIDDKNFQSCINDDNLCTLCGYTRIYKNNYKFLNKCRDCSIPNTSAQDVLFELSRQLNSVIDGETNMTAEQVLQDISKTVAKGLQINNINNNIYKFPSTLSSNGACKETVNPVNLRLYGKSNYLNQSSHKASYQCTYDNKVTLPAVFLVPRCTDICAQNVINYSGKSVQDKGTLRAKNEFDGNKRKCGVSRLESATVKYCYTSNDPVYSTLDPSDESLSYGVLGELPNKRTWNEDITTGFNRNLDFTLDGTRAERLGRTIARAKRRRQWCRALTALFGLVFFILSVIVVSMSITKGQKIFGSM